MWSRKLRWYLAAVLCDPLQIFFESGISDRSELILDAFWGARQNEACQAETLWQSDRIVFRTMRPQSVVCALGNLYVERRI